MNGRNRHRFKPSQRGHVSRAIMVAMVGPNGLRGRIEAGELLLGTFLDLGAPVAAEIGRVLGFGAAGYAERLAALRP